MTRCQLGARQAEPRSDRGLRSRGGALKGQISLPQIMVQIQDGKVVPIYAGKDFINKLDYPLAPWSKR